VNGPRNLVLAVMFVILAAGFSTASDIYIAQNAAGGNNGADCADAHPVSFFNTSSNWGSGSGQIGAGTTVHLCGTITSELMFHGSGTSGNVIELLFETGAKIQLSPGADSNGAVNLNGNSYLLIDGGLNQPCGWNTATNASEGSCNGIIENMLYGSSDGACPSGTCTTQAPSTDGTLITGSASGVSNIEIRNLEFLSYVHTTTGNSGNDSGGTSCIYLANGSNWNIHDNKLHDGGWCISLTWSGNGTYSNWSITRNEIYRSSHMLGAGGANAAKLSDLTYAYNYTHDMGNWDTTSDAWHANSIHTFGSSTSNTINGLYIYNNIMTWTSGQNITAQIFIESQGSVAENVGIFNNIVIGTPGRGLLFNTCGSACYVFNNTFNGVSGNGTLDYIGGNGGTNTPIALHENNALISGYYAVDVVTANFGTIDYDAYGPSANSCWVWGSAFYGCTQFSSWQSASGEGSHSFYKSSGLGLNTNNTLQSGSPLIGSGANLTSTCTGLGLSGNPCNSDLAGIARPSSGGWDIGAYQAGTSSPPPNPPTGLAATVN
jgi:hypothetical protein